ncbi:5-hydroxytryptamine receptor 3A-like [Ascaphus truei]|uniref:5-hydroxytryptamine receptor 3A-like n=1 Tax=Ascaphus truei TaxID=8439 RepID=UPI003F5A57BE
MQGSGYPPHAHVTLRTLLLVYLGCAVTRCQKMCSYSDVTDTLGVLESSPRLMYVRPVRDWTETTQVTLDVTYRAVLDMDEKLQILTTFMDIEMIWVNQFLSWNPPDYCGISRISVPETSIWIPDISISEMTEDASLDVTYLHLFHEGTVRRKKTLRVLTTCSLDLFKFPFDTQRCNLTFGLHMHPAAEVMVSPGPSAVNATTLSKENFAQGEWHLLRVDVISRNVSKHGEEWSQVIYQIVIKRSPILYVINLIIPACLLVLVDAASMFIPMEGGERLGFKITVVLGFSVLLLILNDFLPNSDNPPILGVFCMVCLMIMIISIIDSIFISYMLHLSAVRPDVPRWLKLWVLKRLAYVLRINTKEEASDSEIQVTEKKEEHEAPAVPGTELQTSQHLPKEAKDSREIRLLKRLLLELLMIRRHMTLSKTEEVAKSEWHLVAFILDRFILILYLLTVLLIAVAVVVVWAA